MNILNPTALYLLLLIPPVVILYFMKLRRKRFIVTAAFLWDKVMKEARVDSFFQKLRFNILLILQILFILFLVSSLIRPYFQSMGTLSSETIFIIDTSAGMKTDEGGKTRFDLAREKINAYLDEARVGSAFMLMGVSDEARILSGFTTDKTKIRGILAKLKPMDTGTDLKPAVLLALSLLKSHPDARIFLVGDRMPHDPELKLEEIPAFNFITVGQNRKNVGITAFDISRASTDGPAEMFVRVDNFSPEPVETFLEISFNGVLREAREANIPDGKGQGFIFRIPADFSGTVKAHLPIKDGLASDNTVQAFINKPEKVKGLLISDDNPFLTRLLSLLPGISMEVSKNSDYNKDTLKNYNIVIWNNSEVPKLTTGNHIFINCTFPGTGIKSEGKIAYPRIMSWERNSPIFRFVDMSDVSIAEAQEVKLPQGARSLMQGEKSPLMFMVEKQNFRGVYVMFDLLKTDWQLLPSFPIFMANAVNYLGELGGLSGIELHKTGEILQLEWITKGTDFEVKDPSGKKVEEISMKGDFPGVMLQEMGTYQVKSGNSTVSYPVNLVNREESNIEPDPPMAIKETRTAKGQSFPLIREIWWELALVGLLVLILEWYIFNRRRV